MKHNYLPINRTNMSTRGWDQYDFTYVSDDVYVDHPSFGPVIISRLLEIRGYEVGIIAQLGWKDVKNIAILGQPKLRFLVSAGDMDSTVDHYSMSEKWRKGDTCTPDGVIGERLDYATVVYCNLTRPIYKDSPIIIGGVGTSLQRLAHYDYWPDKLERSIPLDSQMDLVSYGMGERSIVEIVDALDSGIAAKDTIFIEGTVYRAKNLESVYDYHPLPGYTELLKNRTEYTKSFYVQYNSTDPFVGKRLVESYGGCAYVVQSPPPKSLSQQEMDEVYDLPYMRNHHPFYKGAGGIPATREIKFSLISNRGYFGACSFCTLTFHQGRIIQVRSHKSLAQEVRLLTEGPGFKSYIRDMDGSTAGFQFPVCEKQMTKGARPNKQCLFPKPCKNLRTDHPDYIEPLRELHSLPEVRKVLTHSGTQSDYMLTDFSRKFLGELCEHHVSGQPRIAPEHVADLVLEMVEKPKDSTCRQSVEECKEMNGGLGKNQYLIPYLMSSHSGSSMKETAELTEYLQDLGYVPGQAQDSYPTPFTVSTCIYYAGYDCRTVKKVCVPANPHEKVMQRALIQYRSSRNYELVVEVLKLVGRMDLIGYDRKCLARPKSGKSYGETGRGTHIQEGRPGQRDGENNHGARSGESACSRRDGGKKDSFRSSAERPRTSVRSKKTIRNIRKKAKK